MNTLDFPEKIPQKIRKFCTSPKRNNFFSETFAQCAKRPDFFPEPFMEGEFHEFFFQRFCTLWKTYIFFAESFRECGKKFSRKPEISWKWNSMKFFAESFPHCAKLSDFLRKLFGDVQKFRIFGGIFLGKQKRVVFGEDPVRGKASERDKKLTLFGEVVRAWISGGDFSRKPAESGFLADLF